MPQNECEMTITLYRTPLCPKCKILEAKLKEKGISFTECTDTDEMTKLGISSVPVLCVNDELMPFVQANKWLNERPSRNSEEG